MIVRKEVAEDQAQIRKINELAFGRESEGNLVDAIRQSAHFIPELSLVAVKSDKLIGHILFSNISIETDEGKVDALALAPMAVLPTEQNRGVGSTLVREGLHRCKELGYRTVVVLGHPTFYPKFGFVHASTKNIKAPFDVANEAFMVYECQPGVLDDISGIVKYPDVFFSV